MSTLTLKLNRLARLIRRAPERDPLHYLLDAADPEASLRERVDWLERLMTWVRTASLHAHDFDPSTGRLHNVRLRFLLHLLDRNADWKRRFGATIASIVRDTRPLNLFTQIGLSEHRGFFAEVVERMAMQYLPRPARERDLSEVFLRIFESEEDAVWVDHVPPALLKSFVAIVRAESAMPDVTFVTWAEELRPAVQILGARVASLGSLPEVRARMGELPSAESPFLLFNCLAGELAREPSAERRARCAAAADRCRDAVATVHHRMENEGVSVSLVYTVENLVATIRRAEQLMDLVIPPPGEEAMCVLAAISGFVHERLLQRTLRDLMRANLHLLSSKIVERAGISGEHYITRTRPEYFKMLRAGLGGGLIMVFTTLAKFSITAWELPLFFEGLFYSFNYAGSFLILQLLGFTLATKQPSATASALAGKLVHLEEEGEVREFVSEVCRMTRTQFASLVGNLLLLVPFAIFLDALSAFVLGHHFLGAHKAETVLRSIDPVRSFTILNAALTGVLLWASSIAAGWLENWVVFRQIPQAVTGSRRLNKVFGEKGAARVGDWVLHNATAIGGNVSLGFFMGFTSIIGPFLGLPLDVRHVTLSSASLVFASCSLVGTPGFAATRLILPALGIFVIGFLNFAVSYSLALAVAVRARDIKFTVVRRLLRAVRARLRNHPLDFFVPPKAAKGNAA